MEIINVSKRQQLDLREIQQEHSPMEHPLTLEKDY